MEAMDILRSMTEKDTVALSAATATSLLGSTATTGYKAVRITNLTAGVLYVEDMATRATTPSVTTTDYSFQMAVGESTLLAYAGSIGLAAYSVGGGNVRVEVFG
jgi:hypothetical protein